MKHMVVIDPENANHHKAKSVCNNVREQVFQFMSEHPFRRWPGDVGNFYCENHDRDDYGDYTITEGFYSCCSNFHFKYTILAQPIKILSQPDSQIIDRSGAMWYGFLNSA